MFQYLPSDILLQIFIYLDVLDLINISRVCRSFDNIHRQETLWKTLYKTTDPVSRKYILESRKQGFSWRESVLRNYEDNIIRKKWRNGEMTNARSYQDLPAKSMCKMDSDEWGDILQRECSRNDLL